MRPPNLRTPRAHRNPIGIVAGMAISLPLVALLLLARLLAFAPVACVLDALRPGRW